MTIQGSRTDWSFVVSPSYNEFNIQSDTSDSRPGTEGTRSVLVPVDVLGSGEFASAVLTEQPTLDTSGLTYMVWSKPIGDLADIDHSTLMGIRVDDSLTQGYEVFYRKSSFSDTIVEAGLYNIHAGSVVAKTYFNVSYLNQWFKSRLSTADISSSPSVLFEFMDGFNWRRRLYVVDRDQATFTGFLSFGVRNHSSTSDCGSRFDDIGAFLYPLTAASPVPYENGFEGGSWSTGYLGLGHTNITPSIVVDSPDGSAGTNSLELLSTGAGLFNLSLGISDPVDYSTEVFFKFIDNAEGLDVSIRTTESLEGLSSKYTVSVSQDASTITLSKIVDDVSTILETYTTPASEDLLNNTWYGVRVNVYDDGTDVQINVDLHDGEWEQIISYTDSGNELLGVAGNVQIHGNITSSGKIRLDDFAVVEI